ncbi:hypothetical protein ACFVWC_30070 [Bacillus mycoides]
MVQEKTELDKLLDRLPPKQREELEKMRQEALEEPPGFFEYIEGEEKKD